MALGETSFSQMRLGLKPFFCPKNGIESSYRLKWWMKPPGSCEKHLCDVANPFSGGQKRDRRGSEGLKAIIHPPAFGTRVPERAFCVLRFGPAKNGNTDSCRYEPGDCAYLSSG